MDVNNVLCHFIILIILLCVTTCMGQLLRADILTQFFKGDSKSRSEHNARQYYIHSNNGNQIKRIHIVKDYLDILLGKGSRKSPSLQRPPPRQHTLKDTRNSTLKRHRQLEKIRRLMLSNKLRGSTLSLFKKPHESQLHEKTSRQHFNRMSSIQPVKKQKSRWSRINEILLAILKHRSRKKESTVHTTIHPQSARIKPRLPLQITSRKPLIQAAVALPPVPRASLSTLPTTAVPKRTPATISTKKMIATAHSTEPSTFGNPLKQLAVELPPVPQANINTSVTTTVSKRTPTTITTKEMLVTAHSTEPTTVTVSSTEILIAEQTKVALLSPNTVTSIPMQLSPKTQVTSKETPSTLSQAQTAIITTSQITVEPKRKPKNITTKEILVFTKPKTVIVTSKETQTAEERMLTLPSSTTFKPFGLNQTATTKRTRTQAPPTFTSTVKVRFQETQSIFPSKQRTETVELKPLDVSVSVSSKVTKASMMNLKTSVRISTTTGLPYTLVQFPNHITAAESINKGVEMITSTALKQSHMKTPPRIAATGVTTQLIPVTIAYNQRSITTAKDILNTTENYTKAPNFHPKNDLLSPNNFTETKILVTGKANPFFEKLKNPNFLWNDSNKQKKANNTTIEAKTVCNDECTIVQNVCKNGATCVKSCTGFTCICAEGFTGYFCEKSEVTIGKP